MIPKCTPTAAEIEFLEDRLYEHNAAQTGQTDGQLFAFFIRDEQGEIVAGITGWTWARACEIRQLWVDPARRGQGHGAALLASAEVEARARGCRVIQVMSYSFQAPTFYEKHGYTQFGRLDDFPPGHQNCFLVKRCED